MKSYEIKVETSARHVHLSQADVERLYGNGYQLTPEHEIGEGFVARERETLVGPKGQMSRVAILGPARKDTQIELAMTEARKLGIDAPVRMSGDVAGTPGIRIIAENGTALDVEEGVIIAKRHAHVPQDIAQMLGVSNHTVVRLHIDTGRQRTVTFDDVECRVVPAGKPCVVHIDTDESNAAWVGKSAMGTMYVEEEK